MKFKKQLSMIVMSSMVFSVSGMLIRGSRRGCNAQAAYLGCLVSRDIKKPPLVFAHHFSSTIPKKGLKNESSPMRIVDHAARPIAELANNKLPDEIKHALQGDECLANLVGLGMKRGPVYLVDYILDNSIKTQKITNTKTLVWFIRYLELAYDVLLSDNTRRDITLATADSLPKLSTIHDELFQGDLGLLLCTLLHKRTLKTNTLADMLACQLDNFIKNNPRFGGSHFDEMISPLLLSVNDDKKNVIVRALIDNFALWATRDKGGRTTFWNFLATLPIFMDTDQRTSYLQKIVHHYDNLHNIFKDSNCALIDFRLFVDQLLTNASVDDESRQIFVNTIKRI